MSELSEDIEQKCLMNPKRPLFRISTTQGVYVCLESEKHCVNVCQHMSEKPTFMDDYDFVKGWYKKCDYKPYKKGTKK